MSGARRRPHAALVALAALLVWGRAAREAHAGVDPAPVRIDLETCPPEWDAEIRLALAVELGDERLAQARADEGPAAPGGGSGAAVGGHRLSVRCAEHRVWVVAHDAKTAATLERTLTGDLPAATAPRTIALVAADLLTTFDPALRRRLEPPAKSTPVASPPSVSQSAASPSPLDGGRLSLTAGAVYRTFLSSAGIHAWGGALDARRAWRDGGWSSGLDVEMAGTERSTSIGQASALLASLRASAGARAPFAGERIVLAVDVGVRGGAALLSGRSDDPNVLAATAVHPWAGPIAELRAELALSWFCAVIAAEGGWAAVAAIGNVNNGPALAADGPWLAISLGIGTRR